MLYFPQLSSGATGQFPIQKKLTARAIVNQSIQAYEIKLADAGAAITEWQISYAELNDQELAALEVLFQATEGRLTPFTFVDPSDNLLAWSEAQNQAVWQADPMLTLTANIADPLGGTAAFQVSNAGQAMQILQQSIAAPASLQYCLSAYVRGDQSTEIWLVQGSQTNAFTISPEWMRMTAVGQQSSENDSISFGVALNPGSTVDVFGMQVEAQPAASAYKQTAETGGVYPNARFRDDVMTITTVGPNRNSCEINIINVEHL